MGCFSFMCKKSGEPVLSSSFDGDAVHLFLLKDGEVIEHMYGNYDSYGRVFDGKGESFKWNLPWSNVCDLMHDDDDASGGIAAVLDKFYDGVYPTTRSDRDPNQGWGEHGELMGCTSDDICEKVKEPFHKVLKEFNADVLKAEGTIKFYMGLYPNKEWKPEELVAHVGIDIQEKEDKDKALAITKEAFENVTQQKINDSKLFAGGKKIEPIGKFALELREKGVQKEDGMYWHYTDICTMLGNAQMEIRKKQIKTLREQIHRLRHFQNDKERLERVISVIEMDLEILIEET